MALWKSSSRKALPKVVPLLRRPKEQVAGKGRCWGGGLVLLFWSTLLPPAAAVEAKCGRLDNFAPDDSMQELAEVGDLPWMVSLQDLQDSHVAFGAILSKHWIITTASSVHDRTQLVASVGVAGLKVSIGRIVPHQAFDEITLVHNVALLRTAHPIHLSETVRPVCFPYQNFPMPALQNCWVVGSLHPDGGSSSQHKLLVVDVDPCPLHRIMTTECCSHREGDSVPGCLGYPGAPVVCQEEEPGRWLLKGLLTEGGARCYGPFLYTKIAYYDDWIVSTTTQGGAPVSPVAGRRHLAFHPAMERRMGAVEPLVEAMALNASVALLGLNWTQEANESSRESPEWQGEALGRAAPIYYDYYSGEVVPVSPATSGQPWELGRVILTSLLGLTGWVRN